MSTAVEFWTTVGLSALVGAAVSAAISIWSVGRTIKHRAVIEERQKWRDSLRVLVPALLAHKKKADRERVRNSIALRLNPYQDQQAIDLVDQFVSTPSEDGKRAIADHFQDMLKREWERAKIEASLWPWQARSRSENRVDKQRRQTRRRASPGQHPLEV